MTVSTRTSPASASRSNNGASTPPNVARSPGNGGGRTPVDEWRRRMKPNRSTGGTGPSTSKSADGNHNRSLVLQAVERGWPTKQERPRRARTYVGTNHQNQSISTKISARPMLAVPPRTMSGSRPLPTPSSCFPFSSAQIRLDCFLERFSFEKIKNSHHSPPGVRPQMRYILPIHSSKILYI